MIGCTPALAAYSPEKFQRAKVGVRDATAGMPNFQPDLQIFDRNRAFKSE
jgi:hypothetical protein